MVRRHWDKVWFYKYIRFKQHVDKCGDGNHFRSLCYGNEQAQFYWCWGQFDIAIAIWIQLICFDLYGNDVYEHDVATVDFFIAAVVEIVVVLVLQLNLLKETFIRVPCIQKLIQKWI